MTDGLYIDALTVHHREQRLLMIRDAAVADGQITAVVGASGAGKTLLARAVAGVSEPSLTVACTVNRTPSDIGWMPQQAVSALDPYRSVAEQLACTLAAHPNQVTVTQALERVGLDAADAQRFPRALSGGMAQRVVLAQLLLTGARTLVVDEPTSGLDPLLAAEVRQTMRRIADRGLGILWITHDVRRVDTSVDAVWVMDRGERVEHADSLPALTHAAAHALIDHTPGLGRSP